MSSEQGGSVPGGPAPYGAGPGPHPGYPPPGYQPRPEPGYPPGPHLGSEPGYPPGPHPGSGPGPQPGYQGGYPHAGYLGGGPGYPPPAPAASALPGRVVGLQALALLLVIAGLAIPENGVFGVTSYPAWAGFAVVAALVALLAYPYGRSRSWPTEQSWTLAAVGTGALLGYWVIVVLPAVTSNVNFAQTLGVACAAAALWLAPGRRR
ncbi:MAG: hypothetical protein ACR2KN_08895 [Geodermatophilaceae bacterium]